MGDFSFGLKLGIALVMLTVGLGLFAIVWALGVVDAVVQFVKLHRGIILPCIGWLILTAVVYKKTHKEEVNND